MNGNGNPPEFPPRPHGGVPPDPASAPPFHPSIFQQYLTNGGFPNVLLGYGNVANGLHPTTTAAQPFFPTSTSTNMNSVLPLLPAHTAALTQTIGAPNLTNTTGSPYDHYYPPVPQRDTPPTNEWKHEPEIVEPPTAVAAGNPTADSMFDFPLGANQNLDMAAAAATNFYGQFLTPDSYAEPYHHYAGASWYYNPAGAFGAAANCVDLMHNPALLHNNWKFSKEKRYPSPRTSAIAQRSNLGHKVGAGTNNVRVRTEDKYRTVYTDQQRIELEKEFQMSRFVNADRKAQLAEDLQLTERQVKIWFQNRRAKGRKQEHSDPTARHRPFPVAMKSLGR